MPTQGKIALDWGTTRSYVGQCVKRGCPTHTYEAARKWREEFAKSKTTGKRVSEKTEEPKAQESAKKQPAQPSFEEPAEEKRTYPEIKFREPTGDPLLDNLHRVQDAANAASVILQDALNKGNTARISSCLSIHSKACMAQSEAEKNYREELERRNILINVEDAKAEAKRGVDVILRRLNSLAQKMATQVAKQEPVTAFTLLDQEAKEIIEEARRQYVD